MENGLKIIDERELLGKQFKIYGDLENPLFLAKDVANWIEHTNVTISCEKPTPLGVGWIALYLKNNSK